MKLCTFIARGLLVGACASTGLHPLAAQTPPLRVALSGTPAPAGGNFAHPFPTTSQRPVLNNAGQVYFLANLSGGSSTAGLFAGLPGSLQTVAVQGAPAPAGGNYTNSFSELSLNGAGQIALSCGLTGGTASQGLFIGPPGGFQTVALAGTPAPSGGNYTLFGTPRLNPAGRMSFLSTLTGGTSESGLFAGTVGSIQTVALQGSPSPAGGNYSFLSTPAINSSGLLAFFAQMDGGTSAGIFLGTPGSLQTIAFTGNPAPSGGNYGANFSSAILNDAGQVAFAASLTGGSAPSGLFAGPPAALQTVALTGGPAPGGGTYSNLTVHVMNAAGHVAFRSDLTGSSGTSGLFAGPPGAVQAVVLQGTAAPGGGTFDTFTPPQLNAAGQLAFLATLTGAGVDASNDRGLYGGTAGALYKVVREGDQVDVDPGGGVTLRTVAAIAYRGDLNSATGGQEGRSIALSDFGELSYTLTFTDGSSGVFVSSIPPVPEPTTTGLVVAIGLVIAGWRCHRR